MEYAIVTNAIRERIIFDFKKQGMGVGIDSFNYRLGELCIFDSEISNFFNSEAYEKFQKKGRFYNEEELVFKNIGKKISAYESIFPIGIRHKSKSNIMVKEYIHDPTNIPFVCYDLSEKQYTIIMLIENEVEFLEHQELTSQIRTIYEKQGITFNQESIDTKIHYLDNFSPIVIKDIKDIVIETAEHQITKDRLQFEAEIVRNFYSSKK